MTSDLPIGWQLQAGASGFRAVNRARLWATDVYLDKEGVSGQERAINAAMKLERAAGEEIARVRRLCEGLRECFGS